MRYLRYLLVSLKGKKLFTEKWQYIGKYTDINTQSGLSFYINRLKYISEIEKKSFIK